MTGRLARICFVLTGPAIFGAYGIAQSAAIEDFYCEKSYTNFASGYQHFGSYVDGGGHVFAFGSESSNPGIQPWQPRQPESPTKQELEDKYSHDRRPLATVETQKLTDVRRWLTDARNGSLSKKVQRGADIGSSVTACWIRESGTETYRQIELDVSGDWSYTNTAPAARELVRWLASITKK